MSVEKLVNSLSNNFEYILILNACLFIGLIIVYILVKLTDVTKKTVYESVEKFISSLIFSGVALMLLVTIYVYWVNYERVATRPFDERVLPDTSWVAEELDIYFISGNTLKSIHADGSKSRVWFTAPGPIREYHFSPDGKYLLIVTTDQLFLVDRGTTVAEIIDSIDLSEQVKGSIRQIRWAPDSTKFCYEITQWRNFTSRNGLWIYSIDSKKKVPIKSPTRQIDDMIWDQDSTSLYSFHCAAVDTSQHTYRNEIRIFKIPLKTMKPELIERVPYNSCDLDPFSLDIRDINLFLGYKHLSYGIGIKNDCSLVSSRGSHIGIDADDHMYYVKNRWWKKRLFQVPRIPYETDIPRHQYMGGERIIRNFCWLPGGRYVIMGHKTYGILILEPETGRIGILANEWGDTFGWYN